MCLLAATGEQRDPQYWSVIYLDLHSTLMWQEMESGAINVSYLFNQNIQNKPTNHMSEATSSTADRKKKPALRN